MEGFFGTFLGDFLDDYLLINDSTNLEGRALVANGGIGPVPFSDTADAAGFAPGGFAPVGVAFAGNPLLQSTIAGINQAVIDSMSGLGNFINTGSIAGFSNLQPLLSYNPTSPYNFGTQMLGIESFPQSSGGFDNGFSDSFGQQVTESVLFNSGLSTLGFTADSISFGV